MAFRTNKTPVLQEKTASGSVASFNTILQKPLVNGEFTIQAYQEGTGDASPDNVRNIVGFSELNMYKRGINLWDEEWELGAISSETGENSTNNNYGRSKNYIPVRPNMSFSFVKPVEMDIYMFYFYDRNKTYIGNSPRYEVPNGAYYMRFRLYQWTSYNHDVSINYPSTDTDYHAYTGNTYTIQLGQDVYGAEVDVVNGVAHVTHNYRLFDGSDDENWLTFSTTGFQIYISDIERGLRLQGKCNLFPTSPQAYDGMSALFGSNNKYFFVMGFVTKYPTINTVELFRSWLSENNIEVVYPLGEPFDIQLTPTQIETIQGTNTIFADTGDVDLTYNDLDLAKRGSFREVFKLPS